MKIAKLRTKPSLIQRLKPRKTICKECPHKYEVQTKSCHIGDLGLANRNPPHFNGVDESERQTREGFNPLASLTPYHTFVRQASSLLQ